MSKKSGKPTRAEQWAAFDEKLRGAVPHLSAWWDDADEFVEIRVKARPDGTYLAVAKGYGSDGGPVVCFGVGYGVSAALMAIDSTIQGGSWRVDKPWSPPSK